jgi:hypothetical protein
LRYASKRLVYQTFIAAGFSTSSPNTLIFHLPISTHSLGSPEVDSLWLVLVWSIGPDPVLVSPGVDSLKVLFFKLEIVKVGLDRQ